jgi:hypothetical protein
LPKKIRTYKTLFRSSFGIWPLVWMQISKELLYAMN